MAALIPWHFQVDYIETCNCDFSCPCNFSGFPTGGQCETLVGFSIRTSRYADVVLDGQKFVFAASWPRAIHEGNGTACIYVDEQASLEQRAAIAEIAYGRARGGPLSIFAPTFRFLLGPEFVPIEMHIDGRWSRFSVPGVLEASLMPHVDSVSGNEQDVRLHLPNGFMIAPRSRVGGSSRTQLTIAFRKRTAAPILLSSRRADSCEISQQRNARASTRVSGKGRDHANQKRPGDLTGRRVVIQSLPAPPEVLDIGLALYSERAYPWIGLEPAASSAVVTAIAISSSSVSWVRAAASLFMLACSTACDKVSALVGPRRSPRKGFTMR